MTDITETTPTWLSSDELDSARARLPIVYVEAIPVRVDERGQVTSIGLLLRGRPDGSISRAVSLAFIVPVSGDCVPNQDALDLVWLTPDEADSEQVRAEMTGGQDRLVRLALAYVGQLP